MSERDQSAAGAQGNRDDWRSQTTPGLQPVGSARDDAGRQDAGYAAGGQPGGGYSGAARHTTPEYSTRPVTVRRADTFASLLLILAGIAAAVSLLLRWLPGSDLTGWDLVRRGVEDAREGFGELIDTGFWQPLAVIGGGGVLFLLGLLVVLPAKTHRFLGVLALLVSLTAAAGVLVPLADAGWDAAEIDTGFWFAVAVPALGLLGALKAMFTGPKRT
jgi:hypothetical protein